MKEGYHQEKGVQSVSEGLFGLVMVSHPRYQVNGTGAGKQSTVHP